MKTGNFKKYLKDRPMSWSQISSFEYSSEQWYENYILGNKQQSAEMDFGSLIDKKIQEDKTFLPNLARYPLMQYKMKAVFNGISIVGIPDGLSLDDFLLADFKTGRNKWDQKRADETGQLTFYLLLLYITKKIKPEKFKCFIHWLPTQTNGDFTIDFTPDFKIHTFETKRTMKDLMIFGSRIMNVIREMEKYYETR
jgi:hypothetical protein